MGYRGWISLVVAVGTVLLGYTFFSNPNVSFRSSDEQWADAEYQGKGRTFEVIVEQFEGYKIKCSAPEAVLLRTTRQNWINAFAWLSFFTDKKWRVPYAEASTKLGDYYPPSNQENCFNKPWAPATIKASESNARRYLNNL
jgi:hypothetical protein